MATVICQKRNAYNIGLFFYTFCPTSDTKWLDFHIHTMHLDIIKVFYLPTDAQVHCLKINIKIYIKKAPTCFGAVTPSSGSALFVLAEVTSC